jgi:hypothetical protein
MPNARSPRRTARSPWLATVALALGSGVLPACHRDSLRAPEVITATESGPRTTSIERQPTGLPAPTDGSTRPKPAAPDVAAAAPPLNGGDLAQSNPVLDSRTITTQAPSANAPAPVASTPTPARENPGPTLELPILPAVPTVANNDPAARHVEPGQAPTPVVSKNAETPPLDAAIVRAGGLKAVPDKAPPSPVELPPNSPVVVAANVPTAVPVEDHPEPPQTDAPSPDRAPKIEVVDPAPVAEETAGPKKASEVEKPAPKPDRTPVDTWRATLERLRELAHKRASEPGDDADAWALRSRLLDWLESSGTTTEQSEVLNRLLAALAPGSGADASDETQAAERFREAIDALETLGPLQVADLRLCRKVQGYGSFEPIDPTSVRPGKPVILYCEMTGLRYAPADGGVRSRLTSRVEIVAKAGGASVWSHELGTAEDVCRRRRRDYYVNYRLALPANLSPGNYELRLTQTDLLAEQSASSSIDLEIRP